MISSEMFWRPDPLVEEARKLPEWSNFHRACGDNGVCFDRPQRDGKRGPYKTEVFSPRRNSLGGWDIVPLSIGSGRTPVDSIHDGYARCGREVPGAMAMLQRGLAGSRAQDTDFDALIAPTQSDDFDDLL